MTNANIWMTLEGKGIGQKQFDANGNWSGTKFEDFKTKAAAEKKFDLLTGKLYLIINAVAPGIGTVQFDGAEEDSNAQLAKMFRRHYSGFLGMQKTIEEIKENTASAISQMLAQGISRENIIVSVSGFTSEFAEI